jgi:hypothetical protein
MARILIHLDCDRNSQDFVDPPAGPEILAGSEGFVTRHLILLLPIITLSSFALAAGVTFSGVNEGSGPPFPSAPITLDVIGASGDPLQTLLVSIPTASAGAGLGFHAFGSDTLGKFDAFKLENYDFPGQYAERFDGVDPAGGRHPALLLSQSFDSTSFQMLVGVDLPANPPENHLYYTLSGSIYPTQPMTFSNFSALASPDGYFQINFTFSASGPLTPNRPVLLMDMRGTTTPLPEPAALSILLLAALRPTRYHRLRHG